VEPPATTEIPEELPSTQEEPGWARAATDAAYQSPTEELDVLFTEWRPDAAGRVTSRAFGGPRGWSVAGSLVKRAIAAAIVLAAGYFGVQRVRAERASGQPVAAVATDTASAASNEEERTEDVATGRLAEAAEARPSNGGFSAAERAEVRSSLARIGESRVVLVAHLDTLSSMLSGTASDTSASDSTAAERCTRADALYQRSLDDIARIDLARQKLTSLVGPMRMAGVDSLTTITSDMHKRMRELCPQ
ncbi:MAG TPA: hypothetical protein VFR95_03845, partial [Gemmatimonadaceae bacterium]|nr:hypothetical protein [Gemmatimonadaceae bacterium]